MAQHRTKAHKQQVQVKREGAAISYRLPSTGASSSPKAGLKAKATPPAATEALLRQPLALVYKDLIKTAVVSVCIVLILIVVARFA